MLTTLTAALWRSELHAACKGQSALISVDCSLRLALCLCLLTPPHPHRWKWTCVIRVLQHMQTNGIHTYCNAKQTHVLHDASLTVMLSCFYTVDKELMCVCVCICLYVCVCVHGNVWHVMLVSGFMSRGLGWLRSELHRLLEQEADAACSWCGERQVTDWDQAPQHMAGLAATHECTRVICVCGACRCSCTADFVVLIVFYFPVAKCQSEALFNRGSYIII